MTLWSAGDRERKQEDFKCLGSTDQRSEGGGKEVKQCGVESMQTKTERE